MIKIKLITYYFNIESLTLIRNETPKLGLTLSYLRRYLINRIIKDLI